MTARGRGSRGFTLVEVIVVIAVVSILAAMAVPYAVRFIDQAREETTRKQLEEIHRAIVGDPKGPTAGYLGDMGALPASLDRLHIQGAVKTSGTLGVKYGWDGPYVKIGFSPTAYLFDGWGSPLVYNTPGAGQIRSAGPDRVQGNADDITYPSSAVAPAGSLVVNLHVWRTDNTTSQYVLNPQPGAFPGGFQATVQAYYSVNGARSTAPVTAGYPPGSLGPPYSLGPVHAGFHEVFATCTLPPNPPTGGQAVVYVPGNNQQTVLNLHLR